MNRYPEKGDRVRLTDGQHPEVPWWTVDEISQECSDINCTQCREIATLTAAHGYNVTQAYAYPLDLEVIQ